MHVAHTCFTSQKINRVRSATPSSKSPTSYPNLSNITPIPPPIIKVLFEITGLPSKPIHYHKHPIPISKILFGITERLSTPIHNYTHPHPGQQHLIWNHGHPIQTYPKSEKSYPDQHNPFQNHRPIRTYPKSQKSHAGGQTLIRKTKNHTQPVQHHKHPIPINSRFEITKKSVRTCANS